jgi:hypothetical protein
MPRYMRGRLTLPASRPTSSASNKPDSRKSSSEPRAAAPASESTPEAPSDNVKREDGESDLSSLELPFQCAGNPPSRPHCPLTLWASQRIETQTRVVTLPCNPSPSFARPLLAMVRREKSAKQDKTFSPAKIILTHDVLLSP